MLVSVRSLAQRQLNCAWVLGIVIHLHVTSVRVLRRFFGDEFRPSNNSFATRIEFTAVTTSVDGCLSSNGALRINRIKIAAHDFAGSRVSLHATIHGNAGLRRSLQSAITSAVGWISYRSHSRSTSGVSMDSHRLSAGHPTTEFRSVAIGVINQPVLSILHANVWSIAAVFLLIVPSTFRRAVDPSDRKQKRQPLGSVFYRSVRPSETLRSRPRLFESR